MTVCEAFDQFKTDLELTDRAQDQAAGAQKHIRARVETYLPVTTSFLTGSYARYTKIAPLCDIDVFFVRNEDRVSLRTDGQGIEPSNALKQLAESVRKAYPSGAVIRMQSRSVNVQVNGVEFGFDLIPAWYRIPDGYWIPDVDSGGWIPTDPDRHAAMMTDANKQLDGKLKPIVKMAKHWSRNNHDLLRSFHIELICKDVFSRHPIPNWQLGVARFLVTLPEYLGQRLMDPIYGQTQVDRPLTPDELRQLRARVAYDGGNAVGALELEQTGKDADALNKWKDIFVRGFPS
jgi:hypothetical protein